MEKGLAVHGYNLWRGAVTWSCRVIGQSYGLVLIALTLYTAIGLGVCKDYSDTPANIPAFEDNARNHFCLRSTGAAFELDNHSINIDLAYHLVVIFAWITQAMFVGSNIYGGITNKIGVSDQRSETLNEKIRHSYNTQLFGKKYKSQQYWMIFAWLLYFIAAVISLIGLVGYFNPCQRVFLGFTVENFDEPKCTGEFRDTNIVFMWIVFGVSVLAVIIESVFVFMATRGVTEGGVYADNSKNEGKAYA